VGLQDETEELELLDDAEALEEGAEADKGAMFGKDL